MDAREGERIKGCRNLSSVSASLYACKLNHAMRPKSTSSSVYDRNAENMRKACRIYSISFSSML